MRMAYDIDDLLKKLPLDRLVAPMDAASRLLTRADERIRRSDEDLAEGVRARADFFDTCAAVALAGDLVHLEDLVLHDAGMDRRPPTHELTRAARLLHLRRRLARQPAASILTPSGIRALTGDRSQGTAMDEHTLAVQPEDRETATGKEASSEEAAAPPDEREREEALLAEIDNVLARSAQLARGAVAEDAVRRPGAGRRIDLGQADDADEPRDRIADWLDVLARARDRNLPEVLTAALLLDAWAHLQPLDGWPELGRFLVQCFLAGEVTPNHLPPLCAGLRKSPFRLRRGDPLALRLAGLLGAMERTAQETLEQMDRLQIARDRLRQACGHARRQSRLPDFAGMFLAHPLVTIPMARRQLGVTAAAVDGMIRQLGPALPRELTGRDRYRAWGIL